MLYLSLVPVVYLGGVAGLFYLTGRAKLDIADGIVWFWPLALAVSPVAVMIYFLFAPDAYCLRSIGGTLSRKLVQAGKRNREKALDRARRV